MAVNGLFARTAFFFCGASVQAKSKNRLASKNEDQAIRLYRGEHQILLDRTAVSDFLKRFLDAKAARIGEPAGRILFIVRP